MTLLAEGCLRPTRSPRLIKRRLADLVTSAVRFSRCLFFLAVPQPSICSASVRYWESCEHRAGTLRLALLPQAESSATMIVTPLRSTDHGSQERVAANIKGVRNEPGASSGD